MKSILLLVFVFASFISFSQIPKSGTYIYKYCDLEYNKCLSTCKVVIKGNHIMVYATKELAGQITGTKEGDMIIRGIIFKHKSGKWIVVEKKSDKYSDEIYTTLDFKKRQYWQF